MDDYQTENLAKRTGIACCNSYLSPAFSEFTPEDIVIHTAPADTCISDAANEGYHILHLLEGTIKVRNLSHQGKRVLLDEVHAMSFCGHIRRLQGHCFDSNLVTHTQCTYLEFTMNSSSV